MRLLIAGLGRQKTELVSIAHETIDDDRCVIERSNAIGGITFIHTSHAPRIVLESDHIVKIGTPLYQWDTERGLSIESITNRGNC